MKKEIVLRPNPNQLIILRQIQKFLKGFPILPLCIKSPGLKKMDDRIEDVKALNLEIKEKKLLINVELKVNSLSCHGEMPLCQYEKELPSESELVQLQNKIFPQIKKFSPVKISLMEEESLEKGKQWKILKEKWLKF
ncbi:MAG: hypothetical protein K5873_12025 [Treponema sp.]|nr:hypothetical protein [Treponema sp.]